MGSSATDHALAELTASGVLSGAAAQQRSLPVLAAFGELLPSAAVQRGSVVGCAGAAAVSLALAFAAGPSQAGAWVGVAGLPQVGVAAAVELGVAPQRLVMVSQPAQRFDEARWAEVLAAMIDGFDVVLVGPEAQGVRAATARRLLARLQSRGAVMVTVAAPSAEPGAGPFGADLRMEAAGVAWEGLGDGHGVARSRRAEVHLSGRRVPRPRRAELWLPGPDGTVEPVLAAAPATVPATVPAAVPAAVHAAVPAAIVLERAG